MLLSQRTKSPTSLFALLLTFYHQLAVAQELYYFTGAVAVSPAGYGDTGYTYASGKVCPQEYPVACDSIGAAGHCCPASNTCSWYNSEVACCAVGRHCSGWGSGAGGYRPLTEHYAPEPTTVYQQATETVYDDAGAGVYVAQETEELANEVYYCSTIFMDGPNLPTSQAGQCGTVLIIQPSIAVRWKASWGFMTTMFVMAFSTGLATVWW